MNTWMMILIVLLMAIFIFYLIEKEELKKFTTTEYQIFSEKIEEPIQVAVVADLHNHVYGKCNESLFEAIRKVKPDCILIPGDLFTQEDGTSTESAIAFLKEAIQIAPIYYSNGNHETRLQTYEQGLCIWEDFRNKAEELGVVFINNCSEELPTTGNKKVIISGYEADISFYAKGKKIIMPEDEVLKAVKKAEGQTDEDFCILLAHNPIFFEQYKSFGADLTISGHMHGGLVRIPGLGSVISPQFKLFPKYDAGRFSEDGKELIISKGLGTHTFNIRVFNRAELLSIRIQPK